MTENQAATIIALLESIDSRLSSIEIYTGDISNLESELRDVSKAVKSIAESKAE